MSLKIKNATPNIESVIIDQADGQYSLETSIKFLAKNLQTMPKDYFLLYSTSSSLTAELVGNRGKISEYISKQC